MGSALLTRRVRRCAGRSDFVHVFICSSVTRSELVIEFLPPRPSLSDATARAAARILGRIAEIAGGIGALGLAVGVDIVITVSRPSCGTSAAVSVSFTGSTTSIAVPSLVLFLETSLVLSPIAATGALGQMSRLGHPVRDMRTPDSRSKAISRYSLNMKVGPHGSKMARRQERLLMLRGLQVIQGNLQELQSAVDEQWQLRMETVRSWWNCEVESDETRPVSTLSNITSVHEARIGAIQPTKDGIRRMMVGFYHTGLIVVGIDDKFDAPRVFVPAADDLRVRILHEYHDAPVDGHLGREKTFAALSRDFYLPHMYKWVRKWVRSCEMCQRVKPAGSAQAPLRPLPIATESWRSVSMDFIFGLPPDDQGSTGVLSSSIVSARWFILPQSPPKLPLKRLHPCSSTLLGTRLLMSTAAHPETDGQTERVNRVLADVLRSYATSFSSWSEFLPLVEFALNNAVHASSGLTPFFVNYARHPRVPALLAIRRSDNAAGSALGGGGSAGPPLALALRSSGDSGLSTPELGTSQLGTSESTQNLSMGLTKI
ncbi:unnamed protein product [Phytophthora lilii]|uniref:Unnamed protein product n=1 Tax=Phytophthora lilii TaxID=2077276 RepID=A0A9W6X398_9STRA|nr:unnamed protein product [Phytophthora lilii]